MGLFDFKHLLIILLVAMVVFGTKNIRNLGGDIGGWVRDFKKAIREGNDDSAQAGQTGTTTTAGSTAEADHAGKRVIEGEAVVTAEKQKTT